jgi:hypothetical protein
MYGELVPVGGGDPDTPLLKPKLLVGTSRSSAMWCCVSPTSRRHHCQMAVEQGYWFVKDMGSRNGTKVNGRRVTPKARGPGRPDLVCQAVLQAAITTRMSWGRPVPLRPTKTRWTDMLNRSLAGPSRPATPAGGRTSSFPAKAGLTRCHEFAGPFGWEVVHYVRHEPPLASGEGLRYSCGPNGRSYSLA